MGGPGEVRDRLLLAGTPTQHLVLGFFTLGLQQL